jgi:uncharacterized protein YqhQ
VANLFPSFFFSQTSIFDKRTPMSIKTILKTALLFPLQITSAAKNSVGGQAIIEGVMMRSKGKVSWAVKKNTGEIVVETEPFISIISKHRLLAKPFFRGAVNLYESLVLGYKAISRSAEISSEMPRESKDSKPKNKATESFYSYLNFAIAMIISLSIFMYLPMWILSHFVPKDSALLFNTLTGALRIIFFIVYILLISLWKEVRRLFEYHGAEHKAIFTYENMQPLELENMRPHSTLHPRCGTSFIFLVGIVCIFLFSIVDAVFITTIGPYPNVLVRLLVHLALVPFVGGSSYEVLRFSDRYRNIPAVGALCKPGLWLQKITTKEPDDIQLTVASMALKAVVHI